MTDLRARAHTYVRELQDRICAALEEIDGSGRFREDRWSREGGGGGITRVLDEGGIFEKAGVNTSEVFGTVTEALAKQLRGEGDTWYATGVSLVLHPRNPHVPTVHCNFRLVARGDTAWFGGGADLTPYYPRTEDVRHFHATLKAACDAHGEGLYTRYKKWCDEYFYLPHRGEMRGVGGVFFDDLPASPENEAFWKSVGDAFLPAYLPIVARRQETPWNQREREWQMIRRGRYVEFNLVYDRGTIFGLRSGGRVESILMSLPPIVGFRYDHKPAPGSPEEHAQRFYQPRDWF